MFPFQDLATAGTTKRPTCCVLVLTKPTKGELSEEVKEKLKSDYDQVVTEVAEATSAMFWEQFQDHSIWESGNIFA